SVLKQRNENTDHHLDYEIERLRNEIDSYALRIGSFACPEGASPNPGKPASDKPNGDQTASSDNPKTCAEAKEAARQHYIELLLAEDAARFRSANLPLYYDQYRDGITQKTPQIIPALRLL